MDMRRMRHGPRPRRQRCDPSKRLCCKVNAVSSTVAACGGEGAGRRRKTKVKPSPAKQELNSKPEDVYMSGLVQV